MYLLCGLLCAEVMDLRWSNTSVWSHVMIRLIKTHNVLSNEEDPKKEVRPTEHCASSGCVFGVLMIPLVMKRLILSVSFWAQLLTCDKVNIRHSFSPKYSFWRARYLNQYIVQLLFGPLFLRAAWLGNYLSPKLSCRFLCATNIKWVNIDWPRLCGQNNLTFYSY